MFTFLKIYYLNSKIYSNSPTGINLKNYIRRAAKPRRRLHRQHKCMISLSKIITCMVLQSYVCLLHFRYHEIMYSVIFFLNVQILKLQFQYFLTERFTLLCELKIVLIVNLVSGKTGQINIVKIRTGEKRFI